MDKEKLLEVLKEVDIDADDLFDRLMENVNLITRFLRRFPEDKSYLNLEEALEKRQCEDAFRAAHSLKGVCANLSMTRLYTIVSSQVEYLRNGDLEGGINKMPDLSLEYKRMVDIINNIKWE